MSVPVIHYESSYVANANPKGETTFEEFWKVRLAIVEVTQSHGETGPESEAEDKRYWVVDDQYNDDRYHNMEVYEPEGWTTEWLVALMQTLQQHDGWAVSIGGIENGHLLVFGDRLMVNGATFKDCKDLESVVAAARLATENYLKRKHGPLNRQLKYIQERLPAAMKEADVSGFSVLATFDGFELDKGNAIWILQTMTEDELFLETINGGRIRSSAVTQDATIHSEFCPDFWPYADAKPPYWLITYLEEDRAISHFQLIDEDDNPMGTIRIEDIISDEELRRRFADDESE